MMHHANLHLLLNDLPVPSASDSFHSDSESVLVAGSESKQLPIIPAHISTFPDAIECHIFCIESTDFRSAHQYLLVAKQVHRW